MMIQTVSRRKFIKATGTVAGSMLATTTFGQTLNVFEERKKVALVGTGIRGITFWGKFLNDQYSDKVEYVGLCDINSGRVQYAREYIGIDCPYFTDFDEMLEKSDLDLLIVTTVDSTHDVFIVKALKRGLDVISEKPMTTDEVKCQRIINAQRTSRQTYQCFQLPVWKVVYQTQRDPYVQ